MDKNNLTNVWFSKNYVGLNSSLRIRRSKGNTLVDHKKDKKCIKGIKRHRNVKKREDNID